jgi:hypothetical protein
MTPHRDEWRTTMTSINFRTEQAANQILKADKAKLVWSKLPFSDMPRDMQAVAIKAVEAELDAKAAKAALQAMLDDKVEAPAGKRLVVTLGRDVSASTDGVLVAWATASAGGTKVITFDQFIKG